MKTPAVVVIETFGGVLETARLLRIRHSAVSHWKRRDGRVPGKRHKEILALARRMRKRLTADDLIFGRKR